MPTQDEGMHESKDWAISNHRANIEPIFQSVAIDFFIPIEFQGHNKQELNGKGIGCHI
jgi:TPP-dependent pyruvate/acetoin dehydrogenase alpha subunit